MSWIWNICDCSNCSNTPIACFVVENDILLRFIVQLLTHYKLIRQDSGRIIENQVKNKSLFPQGLNRIIIGYVPAKLQPRLSLFWRYLQREIKVRGVWSPPRPFFKIHVLPPDLQTPASFTYQNAFSDMTVVTVGEPMRTAPNLSEI